jgi:hypothetical protein
MKDNIKNIKYINLNYKIELVEENNGITHPYKIGINGNFYYGYASSIEIGFALAKEFIVNENRIKWKP